MPDYRQGAKKHQVPLLDPHVTYIVTAMIPERRYRAGDERIVTEEARPNERYSGKTFGFTFIEGKTRIAGLPATADPVELLERQDALYGLYNSGNGATIGRCYAFAREDGEDIEPATAEALHQLRHQVLEGDLSIHEEPAKKPAKKEPANSAS